jgi:Mrr N-terminal domain
VPEIQIDDEVWEMLKQQAEPFIDTPNSVIRRLLELPEARNGHAETTKHPASAGRPSRKRRQRKIPAAPRAQTGTILADDQYEVPILSILDEHGGRAPTREVLDALGERLAGRLMPADHDHLRSGDVRWRNRAQFVRLRLIDRGDMKRDSPRGVWEISEQGRDRLVAR